MKKLFIIILCVVLAAVLTVPAFAEAPAELPVAGTGHVLAGEIVNAVVETLGTLIKAAVSIFAAWALAKIADNAKLKNIAAALEEAVKTTTQTVSELQQTVVEGLKEHNTDNKLTPEEIKMLNNKLLEVVLRKMSQPAVNLIRAANIDLNAYILGEGEKALRELKNQNNKAA